jgi:hypothetical protein
MSVPLALAPERVENAQAGGELAVGHVTQAFGEEGCIILLVRKQQKRQLEPEAQ